MGSSCVKKTESIDNTEDTSGSGAYHGMNRSDNGQRCHQKFRSLRRLEPIRRISTRKKRQTVMNPVALLAQAAHNATSGMTNALMNVAGAPGPEEVHEMIRRAKAADKTVSINNNCLFIDYQFACYVPPCYDVF
ncbi:UDP-N-acetylmuramoylalanine--D-glutamate ligase [Trichinella spiralis]|uniref:UDP-N-acetylmuramoylalanine--D-glutamate ligase n=1 Tax=Trichinella spiralis TaxID=6334 RepID=A0ABR3KPV7_TRISP